MKTMDGTGHRQRSRRGQRRLAKPSQRDGNEVERLKQVHPTPVEQNQVVSVDGEKIDLPDSRPEKVASVMNPDHGTRSIVLAVRGDGYKRTQGLNL